MGSKLRALGLMLAGCTPPVYARHQDYGLVPQQHRAQAALSDIELIARDVCTEGLFVTEKDFYCQRKSCTRARIDPSGAAFCFPEAWVTPKYELTWDTIRKIVPGRYDWESLDKAKWLVKFCDVNANCTEIPFNDKKQASDFAAAVNAYLQTR